VLSQAAEEGMLSSETELVERSVKQLCLPDAEVDPTRIRTLIEQMHEQKK